MERDRWVGDAFGERGMRGTKCVLQMSGSRSLLCHTQTHGPTLSRGVAPAGLEREKEKCMERGGPERRRLRKREHAAGRGEDSLSHTSDCRQALARGDDDVQGAHSSGRFLSRRLKERCTRSGQVGVGSERPDSQTLVQRPLAPHAMTATLREADQATITDLRTRLLDGSAPLAARYRALFALRNIAGPRAEGALVDGAWGEGAWEGWRDAHRLRIAH